jgi:hypothetical protein
MFLMISISSRYLALTLKVILPAFFAPMLLNRETKPLLITLGDLGAL